MPRWANRLSHLSDQQARPCADIEDPLAWLQGERSQRFLPLRYDVWRLVSRLQLAGCVQLTGPSPYAITRIHPQERCH